MPWKGRRRTSAAHNYRAAGRLTASSASWSLPYVCPRRVGVVPFNATCRRKVPHARSELIDRNSSGGRRHIDHPGDAETVGEHAETRSEESPVKRHLDATARISELRPGAV